MSNQEKGNGIQQAEDGLIIIYSSAFDGIVVSALKGVPSNLRYD